MGMVNVAMNGSGPQRMSGVALGKRQGSTKQAKKVALKTGTTTKPSKVSPEKPASK